MTTSSADAARPYTPPPFPESIRRRPAMYIGSVTDAGLHTCAEELLTNAADLACQDLLHEIWITLHPDGSLTVADDGPGISPEILPGDTLPFAQKVISTFHPAGKSHGPDTVSNGPHGIGACVVAALAERFELETAYQGSLYRLISERGLVTTALHRTGPALSSGTAITFHPDPQIFGPLRFDPDILITKCRDLAFHRPNLRFLLNSPGKRVSIAFPNGTSDFVTYLAGRAIPRLNGMFTYRHGSMRSPHQANAATLGLGISLLFTTRPKAELRSFSNYMLTPRGGTHALGFKRALRDALQNAGISPADRRHLCRGYVAVLHVLHPNPMWKGCIKSMIENAELYPYVRNTLTAPLTQWLTQAMACTHPLKLLTLTPV